MAVRTDTTQQIKFYLHDPSVVFEFIDENRLKVTIPKKSRYCFPYHWHNRSHGCRALTCLQGSLMLHSDAPDGGSTSTLLSTGSRRNLRCGDHHGWDSALYPSPKDLVVLLEVDDMRLYLNILGATLDASLCPRLASTPWWIRILYSLMSESPSTQSWIVATLLWVQLRMIYSAHGFYCRHGQISAPGWWLLLHPGSKRAPNWTQRIQWWSYTPISKVAQGTCYWIGWLFLGMKAEYPEYTPTKTTSIPQEAVRGRGFKSMD